MEAELSSTNDKHYRLILTRIPQKYTIDPNKGEIMSKAVNTIYSSFVATVVFAVAHNLFYAVFEAEEAVFFILTLVSFLIFLGALFTSTVTFLIDRRPRDLWKVGFLGLFGSMSVFLNFSKLVIFYTLFAYFGLQGNYKRKKLAGGSASKKLK